MVQHLRAPTFQPEGRNLMHWTLSGVQWCSKAATSCTFWEKNLLWLLAGLPIDVNKISQLCIANSR